MIEIGNKIIVHDTDACFSAVKKYCGEHLILTNPDYVKKERLGKWTGSTEKYISLYEILPHAIVMPFGCLRDVWRICPDKTAYNPEILTAEAVQYESCINLYPYQEEAVQATLRGKNGVLVMPCGSGKTQCGLEIISRLGLRTLWLTHTHDLLTQSMERAKSCLTLPAGALGTITAGKVNIGTHITFATVQTLAKLDLSAYRDMFGAVVVDECMPADTLIDTPYGKKKLKNLRIDDIITSYNKTTGEIENKRVLHVFKNPAHDIVKVRLENGETITCTSNHPIFTKVGWCNAGGLKDDDYVMRLVWKGSRHRQNAENIEAQSLGKRILFLFKRMCSKRCSQNGMERRSQAQSIGNNDSNKQKISRSICCENERKQSDERRKNEDCSIEKVERDRASSKDQMRQWGWINSTTTDAYACICTDNGSICGVSDTDKNAERFWISDLLQSGYCDTGIHDCNRSGRKFSLRDNQTGTGQEKGYVFEAIRVESVEIQKQTGDGTFGGLCADGYVYNIEVEDNNNYFADGYLVHNCQHCAGSPTRVSQFYKVVSSIAAWYKIGLTATPKRADGLQASMFAILGPKLHEVTRAQVAHNTCPIRVQTIETGYMPEYDAILMGDGTIDYNRLIDNLIHDDDRYNTIFGEIMTITQDAPTMILANRVEYLEAICGDLLGYGKRAVCLSGKGQSKKAKEERRQALAALNAGDLDYICATYQLAAEGLDVPALQYVVFATPEQNETTVIQAAGRVGRKADGKDFGTVIDFVDDFGMYRAWHLKRLRYYRKIGADIDI